jgi:uncharacterized repeat protein (TIGR01451 family)
MEQPSKETCRSWHAFRPSWPAATLTLVIAALMLFVPAVPAHAVVVATSNTVLIDATGNADAAGVDTAQAIALGFDVEVVTDPAVWNAKTTAQFATYKAISIPDNMCGGPSAAAVGSRTVWGPAVTGNVLIVGGDPELHSFYVGTPGATQLVRNGIGFAADDPGKTGLFIAIGCLNDVTALDVFGSFTSQSFGSDSIHIVAVHPALTGLTDELLSNWGSSTHEGFLTFPGAFLPLAIQLDNHGAGDRTFGDGTSGTPFLLVRGAAVQPVGLNVSKAGPATATVGDNITYTITYGNSGGTDATSVVITDSIPAGTTFVSATGGGSAAGGTVTWNIGNLAHGTSGLTVQFTVRVTASGTITNTGYQITDGTITTSGPDVTTEAAAAAAGADPIPTLSLWGILAFAAVLAFLGWMRTRQ